MSDLYSKQREAIDTERSQSPTLPETEENLPIERPENTDIITFWEMYEVTAADIVTMWVYNEVSLEEVVTLIVQKKICVTEIKDTAIPEKMVSSYMPKHLLTLTGKAVEEI